MAFQLVLASQSETRKRILESAGISFVARASGLDEAAARGSLEAEGLSPRDVADALADMKCRKLSGAFPNDLILGADQTLDLNGKTLGKSPDLDGFRELLRSLRGQTHFLHSAAVIYQGQAPVWRHVGRAKLRMRDFSDSFLESYISEHGQSALASAGGYLIEEAGVQLFSMIEGDYFSILGLPLLEVTGYLRERGVLER